MNRQDIKELLREVLGPNAALVDHPHWVGMHCPLAPWTHEGGRDNTPSAGISIKDGDTSIFNCLACHEKGSVPWFLRQMEKYTGENYSHLTREVEDGEFLGGSLPEWGASKVSKAPPVEIDKDTYLDLYDSAEGHWYLEHRGIDDATARILELKLDPADSRGDERILFPVFTPASGLLGFTGRAVLDQVAPRIRDYHGLPKAKALLGSHLIVKSDPFVIVVEGLFDYARLVRFDYPVVATMHSGLTDEQTALLLSIGKPIVWMYDNDTAGITATEDGIQTIGGRLPMTSVTYVKRKMKNGNLKCLKDPAMCEEHEIAEMVDKAKIV